MTLLRRRIVGAVAVLAALALSACAVPGQGDPGVAATYGDKVITNEQVVAMSKGYADLGAAPSGAGEALTMLLIGPDLVAKAEKLGMNASESKVQTAAEKWIAYNQQGGTVTPEGLELVRDLLAVFYLLTSKEGIAVLEQAALDAEEGVVASPRYGEFTVAQYSITVNEGITDVVAAGDTLGALAFTPFQQVSGFAGAVPTWVSGG